MRLSVTQHIVRLKVSALIHTTVLKEVALLGCLVDGVLVTVCVCSPFQWALFFLALAISVLPQDESRMNVDRAG